jgi:metal-responsive CopG/Arc/MetJ family transcriptional regulator
MENLPYPKKVLVAFRKEMLKQIDELALTEHRTRSDLIREAVRRYLKEALYQNPPTVVTE